MRRQRRCVGNFGASAISLTVIYPEFETKQRQCVGNIGGSARSLLYLQSSGRGIVGASVHR